MSIFNSKIAAESPSSAQTLVSSCRTRKVFIKKLSHSQRPSEPATFMAAPKRQSSANSDEERRRLNAEYQQALIQSAEERLNVLAKDECALNQRQKQLSADQWRLTEYRSKVSELQQQARAARKVSAIQNDCNTVITVITVSPNRLNAMLQRWSGRPRTEWTTGPIKSRSRKAKPRS